MGRNYCQVMVVLEMLGVSLTVGPSARSGPVLTDHAGVVIASTSVSNWDSSPDKKVVMRPLHFQGLLLFLYDEDQY